MLATSSHTKLQTSAAQNNSITIPTFLPVRVTMPQIITLSIDDSVTVDIVGKYEYLEWKSNDVWVRLPTPFLPTSFGDLEGDHTIEFRFINPQSMTLKEQTLTVTFPPKAPTILFHYAFNGTLTNADGNGDWGTPTAGSVAYTSGRNGRSALTTTNTYWQTYSLNGGTHFPRDTFSYSVWVKFDTVPVYNQYFTMMHNPTNGAIGMDKWRWDTDGLHLQPPGSNNANYPNQNGVTNDYVIVGQWQMYTFTTTHGGDVKFFCDGVLIYTYTPSWNNNGTEFVTPVSTYWGYGTDANCHYQDFIFYDGELTDDQALYIYNNPWTPP